MECEALSLAQRQYLQQLNDHFTVIERTEENEDEAGEMSYTAFLHRFTRLGNTSAKGNAA